MYETQQDICNFLNYLSIDEVKKAIGKILDAGLLIKANYNKNPFDHTSWYTTPDQGMIGIKKIITKVPNGTIDSTSTFERKCESAPSESANPHNPNCDTAPCIYDQKEHHKEQQQEKKIAAASNSNIQTKAKIYSCLEKVDIPDKIKCKLTYLHDENTVKNAIGWAIHPRNPVKKALAASITYACNESLSDKDFEIKKETPFEKVKKLFENGKMYNQAECFLNSEGIGFQRGMKNHGIKFDKYFSWEKFEDLCKIFEIKI